MTEVEQPPPTQNGDINADEDEHNKSRPADIEQDMREMERRKRVEAIMSSRLFREELERIVDSQMREGGASGILQQLSDIVGVPASRVGSVFKSSNCVLPINDIRGVESMGYAKGEKILRCKLAATFRLLDLYGWSQGLGAQITARLQADQELFLINPYGLLFHEVTASSLNKVDMQGNIVEQGTTNFGINANYYVLHSVVHAARPDIRCAIYIGCNPVVAISSLKIGLLPLTKDSVLLGEIATHPYTGSLNEPEEREKLIRSLGPNSKVLLLNNHGALCCGETIEEAFYAVYHIVQACETQLKLLPMGLENLFLIPEETRKIIYDESRKPPEGYEHKSSSGDASQQQQPDNKESGGKDVKDGGGGKEAKGKLLHQKPKWRVGGAEFEALMRMLDNAGFRTGYIYRHPLVKSELPKPKNDVEVPPAVSSLGYLLEEEELYRQGVWKKSDLRKGGDRTRWLNSPNVYQKVEVLETGTPDPKKITKWVADGSPTHSTPVKIENALQFVPKGTNPKEFKTLQQLIKENRRADKISAGPQSHILEGVTWDEANRIRDATVSATGDHVVLVGAASKGIIQRGYQHNATVYKAPYAKNPFDSVTDDELNEYKRTIERKHGHGEYTDTDFSESEALSSLQTSGAQQKSSAKNVQSQSETEDASEPQVLRIETKQAPKPSQPEVVLSDANTDFLNMERAHVTTSKKPPTGRAFNNNCNIKTNNFGSNLLNEDNSSNNYNKLNKNKANKQNNNNLLNININETINNNNLDILKKRDNLHKELLQKFSKLNYEKSIDINGKNLISVNDERSDDSDEDDCMLLNTSSSSSSYVSLDIFEKFRNPYLSPDNNYATNPIRNNNDDYFSDLNLYNSCYYDISNQYSDILDYHSAFGNEESYFDFADQSNAINKNKLNHKLYSYHRQPYRTLSHFGFNYPLFVKSPEHKHIPMIPTKYKPIRRNTSYEEIFANPSNLNQTIDDEEFNRALKNKALYNRIKQKQKISSPRKRRFSSIQIRDKNDDIYDDYYEDYDFMDYYIPPPYKLDPISEEDECETLISNNNTQPPIIATKAKVFDNENSSGTLMKVDFIKKISNLNYSDESPNLNFNGNMKRSINSDITFSYIKNVNDENVCEKGDEKDENLNSTNRSEANIENIELTSSEKKRRKLMFREERLQRKEEFQELWEDHLLYYSNSNSTDMYNSSDDEDRNCDDNEENHSLEKSDQNIEPVGDDFEVMSNSKMQKMVSGQTNDEISLEITQNTINESLLSFDNLAVIHNRENESGTYVSKLFILMDELTTECHDYQSAINSNSNVGSSGEQGEIVEKISHTDTNARDTSLQSPNNQNDSENELNSIEKKILEKIERSDFDRSEGTIFNKIENAIRNKVTPLKLEKIINKECSKQAEMRSSTPTLFNSNNNGNSSISSLYSLNLSDVKSVDGKKQQISLTASKSPLPKKSQEAVSDKLASHSKLTKQMNVKPVRNSTGQKMGPAAGSSLLKSSNKLNVKLNVTQHCISPPKENNNKSKSKKRNFINENIKNVSSPSFRRHNLGAIFAINPFGDNISNSNDNTINAGVKSKAFKQSALIKHSQKKLSPPTDVYSFETCTSSHGSPRLWVSISSPKGRSQNTSNINRNVENENKPFILVKNDTSRKCQKSKFLNNQQRTQKIFPLTDPASPPPKKLIKTKENIIVGYKIGENLNNKNSNIENEIRNLGKETKKLNKVLNCYDRKFDLHKRLINQIDSDFNEIIELQENIETTRNEFKRNVFGLDNSNRLQQSSALDTLTVSISEDDD